MSEVREHLHEALAAVYGHRPWILALDVLGAWAGVHRQLDAYGATRRFLLAARRGTGAPPDDVPWACLGIDGAPDIVTAIHSAEDALRALPSDVQAQLDAFDPVHEALAIGAFFSDGRPIGGRRMFGARPQAWQSLEDKVVIDAVWDAAGLDRAPCEIVPVTPDALQAAALRLDRGQGTVWAGDAREGFHGGAARTCWVVTDDEAAAAHALLAAHCDDARVMPFLEGIPCSIHGLVLPDGVVVLRPAEMLVLRKERTFAYARAATFWDPAPADRQAMRAAVRQVGEHLRRTVDYRGAFTIDGVMTTDGFRPTELNPRVGAAMGMLADVPFPLMHYALIERAPLGIDAAALEADLLEEADRDRRGSFGFSLHHPIGEGEQLLRWADDGWQPHDDPDGADAKVVWGHGVTGGFINVSLPNPHRVPRGPSLAPRVAAFARWADATLDARIGPLTPAPTVR